MYVSNLNIVDSFDKLLTIKDNMHPYEQNYKIDSNLKQLKINFILAICTHFNFDQKKECFSANLSLKYLNQIEKMGLIEDFSNETALLDYELMM